MKYPGGPIKPTLAFLLVPIALFITLITNRVDKTDNYIKTEMTNRHIPGVSVAVIRDGKVALARGYGFANLEYSIATTPDTVYEIASVTKPFTATAIMMLVEEGKVSLEDKIGKYLPQLPSIYGQLTVRQLLSHTGGLIKDVVPDYWKSQQFKRSDFTREEVVEMISKAPLDSRPGEKYAYSNIGYFLLGLIIEKVSGEPYEKYMADRIFRPLGMTSTAVATRMDIIKNRASGYSWDGINYHNAEFIGLKHHFANGGIISTVLDLAKWDVALNSDRLLRRSTLEQMWTPAQLNKGESVQTDNEGEKSFYGLGWFLGEYRGHKIIQHFGDLPGFSAEIIQFPMERITIIVLCNNAYSEDGRGNAEILARGLADIHLS